MPRSRRLAIASIVAAACLVTAGVVAVGAHTASAQDTVAAAGARSSAGRPERAGDLGARRAQVVSGAVGTAAPGAVRFAYAGDSITARPDSWLHALESDPAVHAVGGYARSGARSDEVSAEVGSVPDAEVLVVEVGTNDVNQAVPTTDTLRSVDAIVRRVGAARVLVVAGPPSDRTTSQWGADRRAGQLVLTAALRRDAEDHGWSFVDPFVPFRAADGGWVSGTTPDGIHPSAAASEVIGRTMAEAITRTAH